MSEVGLERVVVCRSGDERFALPVAVVREVVALPPLTRIPGSPAGVRGLANVHGTLVTVLSGSSPTGPSGNGSGDWLVVLTVRQGQVGLAVDEVEDLAGTDDSAVPMVEIQGLLRNVMGG